MASTSRPFSLRPWPAKDKKPQNLAEFIERVNTRDGGFRSLSEDALRKVVEAQEEGEAVLTHTFDLTAVAQLRDNWFVFRDRRPDLYGPLTSFDGGSSRGST